MEQRAGSRIEHQRDKRTFVRKKDFRVALSAMLFALSVMGTMLLALSCPVGAQQAKNMPRVGFLVPGSFATYSPRIDAFRQGLRDLGYIEAKNISIEYRYANGNLDRLPKLTAELIGLKSDLIVTAGSEAISAAKNATKEIPIVMASSGDAVTLGLVASLARPGGNITGLTNITWELAGKRFELLKEVVPNVTRVAFLLNPETPQAVPAFKEAQKAAEALELKLQSLEVKTPDDFERVFRAAARSRVDALVVSAGAFNNFHRKRIAELAAKGHLPTVSNSADLVEAGALMSYGVNTPDSFRRAAIYVDKILKGSKPADLPVEQPTKFELVINMKTAKQIGLTIPPNVLARADRVIK
jgi:putative ABC transport system substrate-binding protein